MNDSALFIAIATLKPDLPKTGTLQSKYRVLAQKAQTRDIAWLFGGSEAAVRDFKIRCCVGVLLTGATPEERELIEAELNVFKAIAAASSGIPVDFERLFRGLDEKEFVGFMKIWNEEETNYKANKDKA